MPGVRNIVPDMLSRMVDDNIEAKIVDDLPWMVLTVSHQNNNTVSMVTRSKAATSQSTLANQTPPLNSQRMQTPARESHGMAANDVSNDVIDLQQRQ